MRGQVCQRAGLMNPAQARYGEPLFRIGQFAIRTVEEPHGLCSSFYPSSTHRPRNPTETHGTWRNERGTSSGANRLGLLLVRCQTITSVGGLFFDSVHRDSLGNRRSILLSYGATQKYHAQRRELTRFTSHGASVENSALAAAVAAAHVAKPHELPSPRRLSRSHPFPLSVAHRGLDGFVPQDELQRGPANRHFPSIGSRTCARRSIQLNYGATEEQRACLARQPLSVVRQRLALYSSMP